MPTYPALPYPPAPVVDETRAQYGARLFAWVIQTGVTVTLDDDALELATYAGRRAMTANYADARVYDTLNRTVTELARTTLRRATLHAEPAPAPIAAGPAHRPNVGPMAPLSPRPLTNPPAPSYAVAIPAPAIKPVINF